MYHNFLSISIEQKSIVELANFFMQNLSSPLSWAATIRHAHSAPSTYISLYMYVCTYRRPLTTTTATQFSFTWPTSSKSQSTNQMKIYRWNSSRTDRCNRKRRKIYLIYMCIRWVYIEHLAQWASDTCRNHLIDIFHHFNALVHFQWIRNLPK